MTDKRHQLAAEYAMGLLSGDERNQAIALTRDDAEFRAEVARWRGRFGSWLSDIAEAQPPERVWAAIEQRIGVPADSNVIQLKRRVTMWRAVAAAASAIAAALSIVLVTPLQKAPVPRVAPQPAPMVATLASGTTSDRLVATWDPGKRSLIVAAAAGMPAKPGKDHELWVIPSGGKPMAIGVMHRPMVRMTLPMPLASHFKSGVMLAVSVEPTGGSPTGLPTGPVIAAGPLEQS